MILRITDKALLRRRLARAHAEARRTGAGETDTGNGGAATFLLHPVVTDLAERLASVERRFPLAVAHGGQTDILAQALVDSGRVDRVIRMEQVATGLANSRFEAFVADEEALPLAAGSIDLFVSILALQWTNDLPGALVQIRQALRPDGLLLAAMTGGRTLSELRESLFAAEIEMRGGASPRVLPAVEVQDIGALLQRAGLTVPVADRDVLTVRYGSAADLFRDLRAMGATNVLVDRERRSASRRLFAKAGEIYAERFSDPDGRIRATFEIVSLSGWAATRERP